MWPGHRIANALHGNSSLWGMDLEIARDTPFKCNDALYKVIWKWFYKWQSCGPDTELLTHPNGDSSHWGMDLEIVHDTSF